MTPLSADVIIPCCCSRVSILVSNISQSKRISIKSSVTSNYLRSMLPLMVVLVLVDPLCQRPVAAPPLLLLFGRFLPNRGEAAEAAPTTTTTPTSAWRGWWRTSPLCPTGTSGTMSGAPPVTISSDQAAAGCRSSSLSPGIITPGPPPVMPSLHIPGDRHCCAQNESPPPSSPRSHRIFRHQRAER